ncbi:MAG: HAMP domain-containing histidine kinase [Rhodanobacteraceae bacterium]|nr:HAMP domain-containing histidine kinase [Rhodanobacteraceae bacterium]
MNSRRPEFGIPAVARTLAWLRFSAVVGQTATVVFVTQGLQIALDTQNLYTGIALLGVFALAVSWRLAQPWPVAAGELMLHVAIDTVVLGWLLYLTGGATNPFAALLLLPITLVATALSPRHVIAVALMSLGTYLVLLRWNQPLPPLGSGLHVLGMAMSFLISACLLGWFISRLALVLRDNQALAQRIRERALRDEGFLAIATQAAGAAHELNTPLSTMRTLITELRRENTGGALGEDLALLDSQVERCRDSLRELVAAGKAQLAQTSERRRLGDFVAECQHRYELLRPEVVLTLDLPQASAALDILVPAGLRHALLNLLNNAADASLANQADRIGLQIRQAEDLLEFRVRDQGAGFAAGMAAALGNPFQSSKTTGLGIGLALADATAERLGGSLYAREAAAGVETVLALPLRTLLATDTNPSLLSHTADTATHGQARTPATDR